MARSNRSGSLLGSMLETVAVIMVLLILTGVITVKVEGDLESGLVVRVGVERSDESDNFNEPGGSSIVSEGDL